MQQQAVFTFTYPQISEQQGEAYGSFQITLRIQTHR